MKSITRSLIAVFSVVSLGVIQFSRLEKLNTDVKTSERDFISAVESQRKEIFINKMIPRFGFQNTKANITFLQFLQYFGDEKERKRNGYGLSADFFQSIIRDDPYYRDFYIFLTGSVGLNAGMPERSVELMESGLEALEHQRSSDSYYVWRYKGVEELLFLGDVEAAKQSFGKAAEWARESSLPESDEIASISQQTADFLAQNPNSRAAQIGAWSSILTTAVDDETRNRAIENIQMLGGEVAINESGGVTIKYAQEEQNVES